MPPSSGHWVTSNGSRISPGGPYLVPSDDDADGDGELLLLLLLLVAAAGERVEDLRDGLLPRAGHAPLSGNTHPAGRREDVAGFLGTNGRPVLRC